DEPLVDYVVTPSLKSRLKGVGIDHSGVSQASFAQFCPRHLEEARLSLYAYHGAIRAYPLGQEVHDPDWSAADVDSSGTGGNRDRIEHPSGVRFESLRLRDESLLLCESPAEDIWDGQRRHPAPPLWTL